MPRTPVTSPPTTSVTPFAPADSPPSGNPDRQRSFPDFPERNSPAKPFHAADRFDTGLRRALTRWDELPNTGADGFSPSTSGKAHVLSRKSSPRFRPRTSSVFTIRSTRHRRTPSPTVPRQSSAAPFPIRVSAASGSPRDSPKVNSPPARTSTSATSSSTSNARRTSTAPQPSPFSPSPESSAAESNPCLNPTIVQQLFKQHNQFSPAKIVS